jgi:hypothetical protein
MDQVILISIIAIFILLVVTLQILAIFLFKNFLKQNELKNELELRNKREFKETLVNYEYKMDTHKETIEKELKESEMKVTSYMERAFKEIMMKSKDTLMKALKEQSLVPPYMAYEMCIKFLQLHISTTFQRVYASHVLPSLSTSDWKIAYIAPDDIKYQNLISETVLQVYSTIPYYLEKSILFYYNVKDKNDKDDLGIECLTQTILLKIKALLDKRMIQTGERIEREGPSVKMNLEAITDYANMIERQDKDDFVELNNKNRRELKG